MRKYIIALLAFATSCGVAIADVVPESEARNKAVSFFRTQQARSLSGVQVETPVVRLAYQSKSSAYYVYNEDSSKGFVIIAGDTDMPEVLAYSDEWAFCADYINCGADVFLEKYEQQARISRKSFANGSKLISTPNWNQGTYYNWASPKYNGNDTYMGCVACAMGIVEKYYGHPSTGIGSITYNTATYGMALTMNFADNKYDWPNVPESVNFFSSSAKKYAVSYVLRDCGYAVNMDFRTDASSANAEEVVGAFRHNFFFNVTGILDHAYNDDWDEVIANEIDNSRPVIVTGSSSSGVHCFVIDGYQDGKFHYNMGWGGTNNGYYSDGSVGGSSYNFGTELAVYGITKRTVDGVDSYAESDLTAATLKLVPEGNIQKDGYFTIRMQHFCNTSNHDFVGYVKAVLYSKDGVEKTVLGKSYVNLLHGSNYGTKDLNICIDNSVDLQPTDYILLYSSKDSEATWQRVWFRSDDAYSTIKVGGYTADLAKYSPMALAQDVYLPSAQAYKTGSFTLENGTTIQKGKAFNVNAQYVLNLRVVGTVSQNMAVAVCSSNGEVRQIVSSILSKNNIAMKYGWDDETISCTIPSDFTVNEGDRLMLVTSASSSSDWQLVMNQDYTETSILLSDVVDPEPFVTPEKGKYYRFRHAGFYNERSGANRYWNGTHVTSDADDPLAIFYYDEDGHILQKGTGHYVIGTNVATDASKTDVTFTFVEPTLYGTAKAFEGSYGIHGSNMQGSLMVWEDAKYGTMDGTSDNWATWYVEEVSVPTLVESLEFFDKRSVASAERRVESQRKVESSYDLTGRKIVDNYKGVAIRNRKLQIKN